jgi:hypothetical protein
MGELSRIIRRLGSGNQIDDAMIVARAAFYLLRAQYGAFCGCRVRKHVGVRSKLRDDSEKFNAFRSRVD